MSMDTSTIIRHCDIADGSGADLYQADVLIKGDKIAAVGDLSQVRAITSIDGSGLVLAPGFIDVHTHDDLYVLNAPEMTAKISQGITSVVVGNCGISASPVTLAGPPPDPMNLLGEQQDFRFSEFQDYANAIDAVTPAVNVAALVGHTSLRNNVMDDLFRTATESEILLMQQTLARALDQGALGLSSGLAYGSANSAEPAEVEALVRILKDFNGIYTTHLRTEFEGIIGAMEEAFDTAKQGDVDLIISHHKCAGVANWGRTTETLPLMEKKAREQQVACDCYPYTASSSTLDLNQVTEEIEVVITWSEPHPEQAGKSLEEIAGNWQLSLIDAAKKLQPAGAVYHCMDPEDVKRVLAHPLTMIGSDGLPNDPLPHPRLWGGFPRVLSHYCREEGIFSLPQAVHKMTGLSARRYSNYQRGLVRPGYFADLVLFDRDEVKDEASFTAPCQPASGIHSVWVNGCLSWQQGQAQGHRAGKFLRRFGQQVK